MKVIELTEEHIEEARGDCVSDEEDAADPDYVQPANDSGDESNAGYDVVNPREVADPANTADDDGHEETKGGVWSQGRCQSTSGHAAHEGEPFGSWS